MSNLSSNPWSFGPGDVQTQTIATVTLNADGTVTLVGTGNLTAGMIQFAYVTLINVTNPLYNGFYDILSVTNATTMILAPQVNSTLQAYVGRIPVGTAASAGGTVALNQYNAYIRIEDLSWQNASAAGQLLDIRDRNGNIIWQATSTGAGSQNRGKLFWVNGLSLILLQSGVVLATIN